MDRFKTLGRARLLSMVCVAAMAVWSANACAQALPRHGGAAAHLPLVSQLWHVDYDVAADGRASVTYATQHKVAQASALERMKSFSFTFNASAQSAQMLEAYTLKADGRRIPVAADSYQSEPVDGRDARAGAKASLADRMRISLVFPELEVGDSVGVRYRIDDKAPVFAGAFSAVQGFSPYGVHEDSRITVRAAKGLNLRFEAHGLQELPAVEEGSTTVRQWRYQNTQPRTWDDADAGVWRLDESPVLLVSTFADYQGIAKAYAAKALPQAKPTPRAEALAQSVIGAQADPRERARLLYEWVSTQIADSGSCLGPGTGALRDLDSVLESKTGDCAEQATLLQALWAAVGVRSEQVLMNAGELYDLPDTPVAANFNHVINYLPDWQMYVDATAKQVPFGYLPASAYGKPVIHVGGEKVMAAIPPASSDQTEQRMRMAVQVAADGSAKGSLNVSFKGLAAAQTRAYMAGLQGDSEREFVRNALASAGFRGKGVLDRGDLSVAKALSDSYTFSITFDIDKYLQAGTRGGFVLRPVVNLPLSMAHLSEAEDKPVPRRRTGCYGYHSYETYEMELGPGVTFNRVPPDTKTSNRTLNYSATYERTKTGYLVNREVHDATPQGLCSPEYAAQWSAEAKPIAQSLQAQVYYQRANQRADPRKDARKDQRAVPRKNQRSKR
ncbi:DUF3857 and transglutaminase domain-containing protein [Acidovorax sp. DW039]|uniref:DUF3857 domain-containing transglutaminase family protein n=1 Tax=Acidovorax sp. DW039 TaxID=3095606 RepID=UPI003089AD4B|nr:DUF3857 and transglutaminase domain-containing protein [Acidovorax sp. DW039]